MSSCRVCDRLRFMMAAVLPRLHQNGYCYLLWFNAVNVCNHEEIFDLDEEGNRFGAYPLVRHVLGRLFSVVDNDLFLPSVMPVCHLGYGWIYHVDQINRCVKLSELFMNLVFSNARVGANRTDVCMDA